MKKFRIIQRPKFRRPLIISSSVMCITAVIALSVTGIFNYTPNTSTSFPYVQPPAGERQHYYFEITPEALWEEFLSPYTDTINAETMYNGRSFIFKNISMDENRLKWRHDTYIIIDAVQFVPNDPLELQKLKEGDVVDIIGICAGLSENNVYIVVGNCHFIPAGTVSLPLPGGPAAISPTY